MQWTTVRLVVSETMGAVTTAKWNHRGEEAYLRCARGDEPDTLGLRKTTLRVECPRKQWGLNAEITMDRHPTERGGFSLDIPFYRTCRRSVSHYVVTGALR
jgi:hypothetical protein